MTIKNEKRLKKNAMIEIKNVSLILMVSLLGLLYLSSCGVSRKDTPDDREQLIRKELGITIQTKWSHNIVNQKQYYDEEGRLIDEKWLNPNGVVVTRRVLEYDDQTGKLDNTIWYKGEQVLRSKYHYSYDQDGNLVEELWLTPFDEIQTRTVYNYDNGDLIEEIKYDRNDNLISTAIYLYRNGFLNEYIERDRRDDIVNRHLYSYNSDGDLIEESWLNESGEVTVSRVYSYVDGLMQSKTEYRYEEFYHRAVYEYDSNGLIVQEIWYNESGEPIFENQYTYDY
ncbi:MAG: hypothetical protein K0B81_04565 [Candidatus Cloacimonetes bacterium]|nr:hypothetical protein [Candidatus Cloacimonadota bacterium]